MGTDKAFLALDGKTLLERSLEAARAVSHDVWIVGDPAKFSEFAPTVADVWPNCGPLGGIHAALRSSPSDLNLVLAVDIPFATGALLEYLVEQSRHDRSATVTIARTRRGFEPLCAVYRRSFADAAQQALKTGRYKIDALFDSRRTHVISEEELTRVGFSPDMFRNLNTQSDLAEASEAFGTRLE